MNYIIYTNAWHLHGKAPKIAIIRRDLLFELETAHGRMSHVSAIVDINDTLFAAATEIHPE